MNKRFTSPIDRASEIILLAHQNFLTFIFLQNEIQDKMKKSDLPSKICVICKRPFKWRKKWSKVWKEVKYCSNACRKKKLK